MLVGYFFLLPRDRWCVSFPAHFVHESKFRSSLLRPSPFRALLFPTCGHVMTLWEVALPAASCKAVRKLLSLFSTQVVASAYLPAYYLPIPGELWRCEGAGRRRREADNLVVMFWSCNYAKSLSDCVNRSKVKNICNDWRSPFLLFLLFGLRLWTGN